MSLPFLSRTLLRSSEGFEEEDGVPEVEEEVAALLEEFSVLPFFFFFDGGPEEVEVELDDVAGLLSDEDLFGCLEP